MPPPGGMRLRKPPGGGLRRRPTDGVLGECRQQWLPVDAGSPHVFEQTLCESETTARVCQGWSPAHGPTPMKSRRACPTHPPCAV